MLGMNLNMCPKFTKNQKAYQFPPHGDTIGNQNEVRFSTFL